jgi:hypothetical protein
MTDDKRHDPLTLGDQHVNHMRRFAGLPPMDAKEMAAWRGYLRWMRGVLLPSQRRRRRQRHAPLQRVEKTGKALTRNDFAGTLARLGRLCQFIERTSRRCRAPSKRGCAARSARRGGVSGRGQPFLPFKLHDDGFVCFVHRVAAVHRDKALRDGLVVVGRAAHPIVDLRKIGVEQHLCEAAIGDPNATALIPPW